MEKSSKSTALDVIEGHDLTGKEAIVTGASSGIGVETVRALASAGARVVVATRSLQVAQEVAKRLSKETGSKKIEAERLDLASLQSVHEFSQRYLAKNRPLHYLINNAGVLGPLAYTEDGFEMQIGTNHFGHFALTMDLIPALKEGAKQSGKNARVINVTSVTHSLSDINFDDINWKKSQYNPWIAHAQSKTANILFSVGLTKRFAKYGIFSNAVVPGALQTSVSCDIMLPKECLISLGILNEDGSEKLSPKFKTHAQRASTIIYSCVASELENRGGLYLSDCQVAQASDAETICASIFKLDAPKQVANYALNELSAERLWRLSENLTQRSQGDQQVSVMS